jgi:nucleotide-binding universal stress UspA family protein
MGPYRHILCPVDFSDPSRAALRWAARFSKGIDARLTVLNAIDTRILSIGNLIAVPDLLDDFRKKALDAASKLKAEMDLTGATFEIVDGIPEDVILSSSGRGEVDLVVMGTHGFSAFQKFFLGSVTEKVLHRARVPVLSISSMASAGQEPSTPKVVLMAIDLGPESPAVVRHGTWLAEHFGAKLIALHAVRTPYVALSEGGFEPLTRGQIDDLTRSLVTKHRQDLEALLPEPAREGREALVEVGSPYELLRDAIVERSVDLAILGAGGHGQAGIQWLGSTCHKMVRLAPCPVMVVR